MKMLKFGLPAVVGLMLAMAVSVAAAESRGDATKPTPAQEFLLKHAELDKTEIEMGELAKKNSKNEQVRKFAQTMIDEHDKSLKNLLEHFKDLKTGVVAKMNKEHQDLYNELSKLEGEAFDRKYMETQVKGHKMVLEFLQTNATKGEPLVRAWSEKQVKNVQNHLKQAEEILKSLNK
jgi:putative membrane protein